MPVTIKSLSTYKSKQQKFAVLTAYDASFATVMDAAAIDVIMVGDSLGMVVQGHRTTVPVTIEAMVYHTQCVSRSTQHALIIADLPFMSYSTIESALKNATQLMQAGAHVIKLEGGQWLIDTIQRLSECGIPVCAHLGLTPQSVNKLGGYFVQGNTETSQSIILSEAKALEQAGADILVLECVPSSLGKSITEALTIPTIGIGAGPDTDGQVLVIYDILGISPGKKAKFVKNFLEGNATIQGAITAYINAVKSGTFPDSEHSYP